VLAAHPEGFGVPALFDRLQFPWESSPQENSSTAGARNHI
jgi:hypothetical protein